MKKIINLFALSFIVVSGAYALPNQSNLQIQVDQTKSNQALTTPKPAADINQEPATQVAPNTDSKENFVPDHDLAKEIYKAIRDDRIFSTDSKIKIQVTVYNGRVTLSGDVTSEAEKARAGLLATQINKLNGVTNNIRVVSK